MPCPVVGRYWTIKENIHMTLFVFIHIDNILAAVLYHHHQVLGFVLVTIFTVNPISCMDYISPIILSLHTTILKYLQKSLMVFSIQL